MVFEFEAPPTLQSEDLDEIVRQAITFSGSRLPMKAPVVVEWRNYPVTAGRAYMQEARICLSKKLLNTAIRVYETVLHEYAHLYVYENYREKAEAHGREWRAAMKKLGLKPKVTHEYEVEHTTRPKPYVCCCERCGYELRRTRPLKRNRIYHHIGCGGRIRFKRRED